MTSVGGLEELAARVAHFEHLLAEKQKEESEQIQAEGQGGDK